MKLLLTSYKLHDAIHQAVSSELSGWLDANAKKWRVQVRWDLPDTDTEQLAELAASLRGMLNTASPKRAKAIERLLAQLNGTAEPQTVAKPEPKPEPKVEPKVEQKVEPKVEKVEKVDEKPAVAQAPEPAQTPPEPVSPPKPALVAQITLPSAPSKPMPKLAPEESPAIPPPELRAGVLLSNLFNRIQNGE